MDIYRDRLTVDLYADVNKPVIVLSSHTFKVEVVPGLRLWEDRFTLFLDVDSYGVVTVQDYSHWFGKRGHKFTNEDREEVYEYLMEWELAEWRSIGPEDRELFATKLLDRDFGLPDSYE